MLGDIVLIHSDSTGGVCPHVALSVGRYRAIHALPAPARIEVTLIQELLAPSNTFTVWRHQGNFARLADDDTFREYLQAMIERWIGEHYPPQFLRDHPGCSVCSELVGRFYELIDWGFDGAPARLTPVSIQAHVSTAPGWEDVTHEYSEWLGGDELYAALYKRPEVRAMAVAALGFAKENLKVMGAIDEESMVEGDERFDDFDVGRFTSEGEAWHFNRVVTEEARARQAAQSQEGKRMQRAFESLMLFDEVDPHYSHFMERVRGVG